MSNTRLLIKFIFNNFYFVPSSVFIRIKVHKLPLYPISTKFNKLALAIRFLIKLKMITIEVSGTDILF